MKTCKNMINNKPIDETVNYLKEVAKILRVDVIDMIYNAYNAKSGHPGDLFPQQI